MRGTFYCFIAQGQSRVGMMMDAGGGYEAHWKNTLRGQYPGSEEMELVIVAADAWQHPPVGDLGETLPDLTPYYSAMLYHLIAQLGLPREQAEAAVMATKTRSIVMAARLENKLTFGVPVEDRARESLPVPVPAAAGPAVQPPAPPPYAPPSAYPPPAPLPVPVQSTAPAPSPAQPGMQPAQPGMQPAQPGMQQPPAVATAKKPSLAGVLIGFGVTLVLFLTALDTIEDTWYLYVMFIGWDIVSLINYFARMKTYKKMQALAAQPPAASRQLAAPAHIHVIRDSSMVGAVVPYQVYLNGNYFGEVRNGKTLTMWTGLSGNVVSVLDNGGNAFADEARLELAEGAVAEIHVKAGKLLAQMTRVTYPPA